MSSSSFDTLVLGAGLVGSSVSFHLSKMQSGTVAVLDADLSGRLSSSELNAGGARATWDQPINVILAKDSIDFFRSHREISAYRDCGYLWMFRKDQWQQGIARAEMIQKKHKIDIHVLSVKEIQEKTPFIDKSDDLEGGTFSPTDGLFNPNTVKNYFREESKKQNVQFLEGHRIKSVSVLNDESIEVECELIPPKNESELKEYYERDPGQPQKSSGETRKIRAKQIVNCTGAWASKIAKLIGYDSPVWAVRRQVSIFDTRGFDFSHYGMMVDPSGVYFHPEATNILGGYADPDEPKGWNLNYDGESFFQEKIWSALYERSTKFEELRHLTGWGGLYEMTPDKTAIIGRVEKFKNVFECHGFSGRGAMQSYAAGRGIAELIATGKYQSIDLNCLNGSRFQKNELVKEGLHI
ncbi:MAG: FAD-binding oxidoreductase [Oligoflexia bacterium]|nr:FAD-binding oxidoreductase [Oligoflexia bacterium]